MKKNVGNDKILRLIQKQIIQALLLGIRYSENIVDVLAIKEFVPILTKICNKNQDFQNKELLLICVQIFQTMLYSNKGSKEELMLQAPILEDLLEKILFLIVENYDDTLRNIALSCLVSIIQMRIENTNFTMISKLYKLKFKNLSKQVQESYKNTEIEKVFALVFVQTGEAVTKENEPSE